MPRYKIDQVWTVDVNTSDLNQQDGPVQCVYTKREAIRRVKALNKKYGHGVPFEDGMVEESSEEFEKAVYNNEYLYYTVGSFYIEEPFELDQIEKED